MSFAMDASAAVALHFLEERPPFETMEDRLASGEEAFTAPNFYQAVMEALRGAIREGRTTSALASAWLVALDAYNVHPLLIHPCAGSATWIIAEQLNISAYDAVYIAVAKSRGAEHFSRDAVILRRAGKVGVKVKP
ncbi:MAG TPA: type II toxin-antitoxin system VapC family toxin [Verrucomicrobiae bacterium]|jgi:predicted nucleic acid-binding protein